MDLSEITSLAIPDAATLGRSADAAVRMAQAFTITSPDDYSMAAEELRSVASKIKALEEKREAITGPLHRAHKAVMDLFRTPMTALEKARDMLKGSMIAYDDEQERKEKAARAEAERIAQVERDRLAAEQRRIDEAAADEQRRLERAERHRQQQEEWERQRLQKVAEEAAASGDAAALAQAEKEAAEQRARDVAATEAARLESERVATAAAEQSAAVVLTAAVTTAPAVAVLRPAARGISTSKKMEAKVTDMGALVRHVAQFPQFLPLLVVDSVKLRAFNTSGMLEGVPGITRDEKKTVSARAA